MSRRPSLAPLLVESPIPCDEPMKRAAEVMKDFIEREGAAFCRREEMKKKTADELRQEMSRNMGSSIIPSTRHFPGMSQEADDAQQNDGAAQDLPQTFGALQELAVEESKSQKKKRKQAEKKAAATETP